MTWTKQTQATPGWTRGHDLKITGPVGFGHGPFGHVYFGHIRPQVEAQPDPSFSEASAPTTSWTEVSKPTTSWS